MIEVQAFSFTYAGNAKPALIAIDLQIPSSQVCAIVGANGAGKSTLCFALSGFIPHFYRGVLAGSVRVKGRVLADTPLPDCVGEIGLVFQNPFNQITGARFTVLEEVAFGLENLGLRREEILSRSQEALAATGLAELADRSPFALSGGQQQRLAVASILAMKPSVLVLDEPTSQLDPAGTEALFERLHDLASSSDTTIVIAEQKLELVAAFAHRVIVLAGGRVLADGKPREVLTSPTLEAHGLRAPRYTQVARRLRSAGLARSTLPLPITLPQAVEFLG